MSQIGFEVENECRREKACSFGSAYSHDSTLYMVSGYRTKCSVFQFKIEFLLRFYKTK
jgi:hypothetical protein